jgi:hypothetical protein
MSRKKKKKSGKERIQEEYKTIIDYNTAPSGIL